MELGSSEKEGLIKADLVIGAHKALPNALFSNDYFEKNYRDIVAGPNTNRGSVFSPSDKAE